jgi:hypothetical protein
VVIPKVPMAPTAPLNSSGFSELEALTISPFASTISTQLTVWLKYPYLKELLSLAEPAYPPPTVIPGNSITTGGIRPCLREAYTSLSIGTFGSTRMDLARGSTLRTFDKALMSTTVSLCAGRVLLVEPWKMRKDSRRLYIWRTAVAILLTAAS